MKLTGKTLKRLTKGAIYFEEKSGWFTPFSYSREQIEYMADEAYDWGWRMRARFTGGIRLEFKTNSQKISFDYRATHTHERANTIDLYVNGVMTSVYKIGQSLNGKVEFSLPKGEKLVSIYLPNECELAIKSFTLDGCFKSVKDKGAKWLIIGDSITQGAGPNFSSSAYVHELCRQTGYNILAQGMGGYRYEPQDLMKVQGFEPEKIIVFLGTNYYEADQVLKGYNYARAVKEFYKRLNQLYPNTKIVSVTPLWRNNAGTNMSRLLWCIDTIREACKDYPNVLVADGFELIPNVGECYSDGIHPNEYGALLLAANLKKFIKVNKL